MGKGWIKLHRSIMDHSLWKDKPFSRGQAWIDLLMLANHADGEALMDGKIVKVKRGEFITSYRKLSERWGWSRSKTRSFIFALKSAHMVTCKSDTKKTTIKIWNYNKYQGIPEAGKDEKNRTKGHEKDAGRDTEKTQKDTNKNNRKNDKEKKEEPAALSLPETGELEDDDEIVWEDAEVIWEREKKKEGRQ